MKRISIIFFLALFFLRCATGWKFYDNGKKCVYQQKPSIKNGLDVLPSPLTCRINPEDISFVQPISWIGINKGSHDIHFEKECNCVPSGYNEGFGFNAYVFNDSFYYPRI